MCQNLSSAIEWKGTSTLRRSAVSSASKAEQLKTRTNKFVVLLSERMGRGNIGSGGGSCEKRQISEIRTVAMQFMLGAPVTVHNDLFVSFFSLAFKAIK